MMINTHHITNEIKVLKASIIQLGITTADANAEGILESDGTNRGLCLGISPEGTPVIYMTTNGDDVALYDDLEAARNFCRDMGDDGDEDNQRMIDGANRLLEAVASVERIYGHNKEMAEEMDWYHDQANEVLASVESELACNRAITRVRSKV